MMVTPLPRTKTSIFYDALDTYAADWTPYYGTVADDTTYVWHPGSGPTWKSCKLTKLVAQQYALLERSFTPAQDWSGGHLGLAFYIHQGSGDSGYDKCQQIFFRVYNGADYWTYRLTYYVTGATTIHTPWGWHYQSVTPLGYSSKSAGGSASPDWANVTKIRFYVQTGDVANNYTPSVTLDLVHVWERPEKAYLLWRIDDGREDSTDALDALIAAGIRPHMAIITDNVGDANYLTWAQIRAYRDAGAVPLNHTFSHPLFSALSATQRRYQVGWAGEMMEAEGVGEGARIMVLPRGIYEWQGNYLTDFGDLIDLVWLTHNLGEMLSPWPVGLSGTKLLPCSSAGYNANGKQSTILDAITDAVTDHALCMPYMHTTDPGAGDDQDITQEQLDAALALANTYRAAGQLEFITIWDLLGRSKHRVWHGNRVRLGM